MKPQQYEVERWADQHQTKQVSYAGMEFTVMGLEIRDNLVKIHTFSKPVVVLNEDWGEFTKSVKIITPQEEKHMEVSVSKKAEPHEVIRQQRMQNTIFGKSAEFLTQTMKDSIRKVSEDPNYIPQAQEIGSQVKNFIELAKTEVAYLNALNK